MVFSEVKMRVVSVELTTTPECGVPALKHVLESGDHPALTGSGDMVGGVGRLELYTAPDRGLTVWEWYWLHVGNASLEDLGRRSSEWAHAS